DLKVLKAAFNNRRMRAPLVPKDKDKGKEEETLARVYLFDEDNVSIRSTDTHGGALIIRIEGELSGKAPDAFRLRALLPGFDAKKLKKVEVRPVKVPK